MRSNISAFAFLADEYLKATERSDTFGAVQCASSLQVKRLCAQNMQRLTMQRTGLVFCVMVPV